MTRHAQVCCRIEDLFRGHSEPASRMPLWIYLALLLCLLAASGFHPMQQTSERSNRWRRGETGMSKVSAPFQSPVQPR